MLFLCLKRQIDKCLEKLQKMSMYDVVEKYIKMSIKAIVLRKYIQKFLLKTTEAQL